MKTQDILTKKHTAFSSFEEMLTAVGGFSPTFYIENTFEGIEKSLLANEYDRVQKKRGDGRRCTRINNH